MAKIDEALVKYPDSTEILSYKASILDEMEKEYESDKVRMKIAQLISKTETSFDNSNIDFDESQIKQYLKQNEEKNKLLNEQFVNDDIASDFKKLMEIQQRISKERNQNFIGKTLPCIIEAFSDDGEVIARTQYDAPEIDGVVNIKTDKYVVPGDIELVKITSATEYDLEGVIIE